MVTVIEVGEVAPRAGAPIGRSYREEVSIGRIYREVANWKKLKGSSPKGRGTFHWLKGHMSHRCPRHPALVLNHSLQLGAERWNWFNLMQFRS